MNSEMVEIVSKGGGLSDSLDSSIFDSQKKVDKIPKDRSISSANHKANVTKETESFYDEIQLEDMDWDEEEEAYFYPCPCGDKFIMPLEDLEMGEDIALCPSCSLRIRVLYNLDDVNK